jgi:hypothetical protein
VAEEILMPAIELQVRLKELQVERLLVASEGLAADTEYMGDLDDETAAVSAAYGRRHSTHQWSAATRPRKESR